MQFFIQKKSFIVSIILFIFSGIIFIFLYEDINQKEALYKEAEQNWKAEAQKVDNIRAIVSSVRETKDERNLLGKHFVQSSDIVPFLNTVENLTKEVGINKSEISSVNISKDNSLLVEMKASGNFESVYKLITLLENSPYNIEFVSAEVQNSDLKSGQWILNLKMKVLSFLIQ